ncbi:MAG: efflux RND transporter periplasmic adaptor subunit [Calditrichaceae bacterium]|nr:efflux RND transporter periplasmic adaptor subunit [Calditrichaceae bacterium]MBN2708738.1 efflux RND transporter periplasmic adaptor subunit [Calditrichaceae bacterium]RQV97105.1 MAG: efflux RND transporter periplasmic adaptor subunit [Calditrichota bacterium]
MKTNIFIYLIPLVVALSFLNSCNESEARQDQKEQLIPVEIMVIKAGNLEESINLTGVLRAIHSVDIVSEVSGKVIKINKKLGDYVKPGDILARIDDKIPSSNYEQAKAQTLSAENNLKIAKLNLKSDKELLESGDISDLAYENSLLAVKSAEANLLSAQANLKTMEKMYFDTRIMPPFSGQISREFIELGSMVTQGMPLYHIVDLSSLKLEVGVPQDIISRIKPGSPVEIRITSFPIETFEGKVRYVSPQASAGSGSFSVEIHLTNTPDLKILAGMTARAGIRLNNFGDRLTIPDYAIVSMNELDHVYRIKDNTALLTPINIEEKIGSLAIIKDGLAPGDSIVTVGVQKLGIATKVFIEKVHN